MEKWYAHLPSNIVLVKTRQSCWDICSWMSQRIQVETGQRMGQMVILMIRTPIYAMIFIICSYLLQRFFKTVQVIQALNTYVFCFRYVLEFTFGNNFLYSPLILACDIHYHTLHIYCLIVWMCVCVNFNFVCVCEIHKICKIYIWRETMQLIKLVLFDMVIQ